MRAREPQVLRTMRVGFVGVSDLIEEVDFVFREEEGDRHGVYWCITPSLSKGIREVTVRICLDNILNAGFTS